MSKRTLGTGFRYTRIMAWAPALILLVAFLFALQGQIAVALLLAGAALVYWLIVRRRKTGAGAQAPPSA